MCIKLALLNAWTPKAVIKTELAKVDATTTGALIDVLKTYASNTVINVPANAFGSVEEQRAAMAKNHALLVDTLVDALGREKAVALGREALFVVGKKLGEETRQRLGIKTPEDMVKAARVLYRILGIGFTVAWQSNENAQLSVYRCALSKQYSEVTCQVLSAIDEGVINGLCPQATMAFSQKITGGCKNCIANIKFKGEKQT